MANVLVVQFRCFVAVPYQGIWKVNTYGGNSQLRLASRPQHGSAGAAAATQPGSGKANGCKSLMLIPRGALLERSCTAPVERGKVWAVLPREIA